MLSKFILLVSKPVLLAGVTAVSAATIQRRVSINDAHILTLALNLEYLELNFFKQGLANFSSFQLDDEFGPDYKAFTALHEAQETAHSKAIQTALYRAGGSEVKPCHYSFRGSHDVESFNNLAQVITSVGEAAYLGAIPKFEYPEDYAGLATSILGIEARQNTVFRTYTRNLDISGFYNGLDFDTPLTASQAFSLAAPFIHDCPSSNPPIAGKGGFLQQFPVIQATIEESQPESIRDRNATLISPVGFIKSYVFLVYQLQTYRVPLHNCHGHNATITVPGNFNGTMFVISSIASGTPTPVPDQTVKAIGALRPRDPYTGADGPEN